MSASPFAQRTAHVAGEAWRSAAGPSTASAAPASSSSASASSSSAFGPSSSASSSSNGPLTLAHRNNAHAGDASAPRAPQAAVPVASTSLQHHDSSSTSAAASSTAASEMSVVAPAHLSNGSSNPQLSAGERHAAKARRMSPGGSRMPSEERAPSTADSDGREVDRRGSSLHSASTSTAGAGTSNGRQRSRSRTREEQAGPSQKSGADTHKSLDDRPHLNLATFPPQDLLRVLAALLHQIATANDQLRPAAGSAKNRNTTASSSGGERKRRHGDENVVPEMAVATGVDASSGGNGGGSGSSSSSAMSPAVEAAMGGFDADGNPRRRLRPTTAAMAALQTSTSTLCFHARNVPSITIEAYLMRILKYCPTTNEVFLSLLVYFDRMSRMGHRTGAAAANSMSKSGSQVGLAAAEKDDGPDAGSSVVAQDGTTSTTTQSANPADSSNDRRDESTTTVLADGMPPDGEPHAGIRGFAIDSYNVHRLIIAGITVASKFFSDVFYTNSRYAKVGGLPAHELNQLELQFLLLNDFNLMIPLEEMQHYADQLLFYASAPGVAEATAAAPASSSTVLAQTPQPTSASTSPKTGRNGNTHRDKSAAASSGNGLGQRDHHGDTSMQS